MRTQHSVPDLDPQSPKQALSALRLLLSSLLIVLALVVVSCAEEPTTPDEVVTRDQTPFIFDSQGLPVPLLPADNPLTVQTVKLGKMLFHDKRLSRDGSQACVTCHQQTDAFSDIRRFSIGVDNLPGKRQAMPLFNLAWHRGGFFWDGRSPTLRDQVLRPIQDPLEMHETLDNVVAKLTAEKTYRTQFIKAFGSDTITSARVALALEQFLFTIVSANSKHDMVIRNETTFTAQEERGRRLFFAEFNPNGTQHGAECFHCHGGPNFTNDQFMNNGLDAPDMIVDEGRYDVTNDERDRGRFKVPSLRNIEFTAPFMHDGRMTTLEEVVRHYNTGVKPGPNTEPILRENLKPGGLHLTDAEMADLVVFLKTLSDPQLRTNTTYQE